jgi:hypothetical protein
MIGFLHPWLLAALPAAALPLLLHLFARREPPTVAFPAVRYLRAATAEHQRRFRLQHWLLLLARTLLILALVIAAAGPTTRLSGVSEHAPGALVIILDNSASSGAMAGGTPQLETLRAAARAALNRASPDDALWLIPADGRPRRGDRRELRALVDSLDVLPVRLDLGKAIGLADDILQTDTRPGEILLLSDLQVSALGAATPSAPLVVGRPADAPARNLGIVTLDAGAQPWTRDGGRVVLALAGDSSAPVSVTARIGGRNAREVLASVGESVSVALPALAEGWHVLTADLTPDEFRLDDHRAMAVRIAPRPAVRCDTADRYVAAACEVLRDNHRITTGDDVSLGVLGPRRSVVLPPVDPATLGAVNRSLARRGSTWEFGDLRLDATTTDSGTLVGRHRITRRYALVPRGSGRTGVLATAAGSPWAVISGDIILLGSRLDPDWTDLPLSAEFMPFVDRVVNRAARGELAVVTGDAGAAVALPDLVTKVRRDTTVWPVEGGDFFTPPALGVYYLTSADDTIGALVANVDPRESNLRRADGDEVRRLWHGARVLPLDRAGDAAFSTAARADLRGPLLWLALLAGLGEVFLARRGRIVT